MQTQLQQHISLQNQHTFGLIASAKYLVEVQTEGEVLALLADNQFGAQPLRILGGGSNILPVGDLPGITIKNAILGREVIRQQDDSVLLRVGAGENWHELVQYCLEQDWGGLENLSLIPGRCGAAPIQNIGAYGVELEQIFEQLEAIHLPTGTTHTFDRAACEFGYRDSIFKGRMKGQYLISRVVLRLSRGTHLLNTSYGAIEAELQEKGLPHSIQGISEAVCNIRREKLPDPAQVGNAGSFFKNPLISVAHLQRLQAQYPDIPHYPQPNEEVKVPAGWLIDTLGWKGHRNGACGVHPRQALVLVNYGGAKGTDILELAHEIQASVKETFDIELEREVNVWP